MLRGEKFFVNTFYSCAILFAVWLIVFLFAVWLIVLLFAAWLTQPEETISYYLSKNCTEQPSLANEMTPFEIEIILKMSRVWIEDAVQLLPRLGSSGRALPTHEEGSSKPLD